MKTKRLSDPQLAAVIAAALAVVIGIGWGVYAVVGGNPGEVSTQADSQSAEAACRDFAGRRLKAPASAQFSNERASEDAGGRWVVTGAVDSQNSFGALIRNTYRCETELGANDEWIARDLEVTAN